MAADLIVKRTDLQKPIRGTLYDNGVIVDLTNAANVKVVLKPNIGTRIELAASIVAPATGGQFRYNRAANDILTSQMYKLEIHVNWSDGSKSVFPTKGTLATLVEEAL